MSKAQAVILCGGKGSRLRPYTTVLPKPLMPLGDYPIAEVIVRQLAHHGIKDIVMSTGYLAGLIETYFGTGKRWGVRIRYAHEDKPLGTAGAIRLVEEVQDDFLVINGDTLTELNFRELFRSHKKNKGIATVSVQERIVKTDFGVVRFDDHYELLDYVEKPEHKSFVSLGINIFNKRVKKYIKVNESIGIPELLLRLKGCREKVFCFKTAALWFDLGRREDLESAQEFFNQHKNRFISKT